MSWFGVENEIRPCQIACRFTQSTSNNNLHFNNYLLKGKTWDDIDFVFKFCNEVNHYFNFFQNVGFLKTFLNNIYKNSGKNIQCGHPKDG